MRNDRPHLIVDKSFNFSIEIISFTETIFITKKFSLANQIFKSGTSIGANIREAQNAESKKDFIHKMKIACKEADELEYWLMLCKESEHIITPPENLLIELKSIIHILSKIISTSKKDNHV